MSVKCIRPKFSLTFVGEELFSVVWLSLTINQPVELQNRQPVASKYKSMVNLDMKNFWSDTFEPQNNQT